MTHKAAIYARFSTDMQRDRSIDDQFALCRKFAASNGLAVQATFSDRAQSGASVIGRDGLFQLMEAARQGQFQIVIVEALDRLSRDQEDLAGLYKRLTFYGVRIDAVHDGTADAVQIGVRGMLGSLYLTDLAHKVRRGLAGVVKDGRHPGGRAYGYKPVKGEPGCLEVVEVEAAIVRRIFDEYVAGASTRAIAGRLNRDSIQPPRGATWNASTINGNKKRGYGILQNQIYTGKIVWNRVKMVRDPDTGKRVSRVNPQEEWQTADAPQLAIVSDEVWKTAQERKEASSKAWAERAHVPRTRHLLSGLLRCGTCGSGMSLDGKRRGLSVLRCSKARESQSCSNKKRVRLDRIEAAVINSLRSELENPEALALYVKAYREEMRSLTSRAIKDRDKTARKLASTEASISRLVEALSAGNLPVDVVTKKLQALEVDRIRLRGDLERADAEISTVELHPQAVTHYRRTVEKLHNVSASAVEECPEVAKAIRQLIATVKVIPGEQLKIQITGHLAALTGAPIAPAGGLEMVAGEGLEPPTRGL